MNSQITAESAAASTRKGRVAPGAPFPGMSVRDSRNGKPDKQVPDPDASSARSTLLAPSSLGMWPVGRETAARRGVCDGPQGPENPPPALADGREGTRLARLSADGWTKVLGRRKSRKAAEVNQARSTLLVWGVYQDTPAGQVQSRLLREGAISAKATVQWAGPDHSRRIEIVFAQFFDASFYLPRAKRVCEKCGWRCVPARIHETRVLQRGSILMLRQPTEDTMEDVEEQGDGRDYSPPLRPQLPPLGVANPFDPLPRVEEGPAVGPAEEEVKEEPPQSPPKRPSRSSRGSRGRRREARRCVTKEDRKQVRYLTLFSLNIQKGFRNKIHELEAAFADHRADVVALQEVAKKDERLSVAGYTAIENAAPGEPGLLLLVAPHLRAATTYVASSKFAYWIKIKGNKDRADLYVANCHLPTNGTEAVRSEAFKEVAEMASGFRSEGDVAVLGDLNATLVGSDASLSAQLQAQIGNHTDKGFIKNSSHLKELLRTTGLVSLNGQAKPPEGAAKGQDFWWTRHDKTHGSYRCLDYALVSPALAAESPKLSVTYEDLNSDHHAVLAEVVSPLWLSRKKMKRARRKVFRTDRLLLNSSWSNQKQVAESTADYMEKLLVSFAGFKPGSGADESPNSVVQDFIKRTEEALEASVGSRYPNPKFSRRWFDEDLKELVKSRRGAYKEFLESLPHNDEETSKELWTTFLKFRKDCKIMSREKRRAEWEGYIQNVSDAFRQDHKQLWTLLRRVMPSRGKKGRVELNPMQARNGSLATTEEEIMEVWTEHQQGLGTPRTGCWDKQHTEKVRREVEHFAAHPAPPDAEMDKDFTQDEVKEALEHVKDYKSPSDDGTTYTMFKRGGPPMLEQLCKLFSYLNKKEATPSNWGTAVIVNIFKEGDEANRTSTDDYRGIALISCLGKLYLSIWARRITRHAEKRLDKQQGGFTSRRSTPDQVLSLWETLQGRQRLDKPTFLFFIDFRKAFDTVWHDGLWNQLWKSGVQGKAWRILRHLYGNVRAQVRVGDRLTKPVRMRQGVRQGCPLSPVLFNLFVDELAQRLRAAGYGVGLTDQELHALLYADDVVILAESKEDLQKMIDVVQKFCLEWHMELNLGKSQVMVIGCNSVTGARRVYKKSFTYMGDFIKVVDRYKYLGVCISSDLSWAKHTAYTLKKASDRQVSIRRALTNGKIDARARLLVWKSQVRPILEYGAEVWDPPNHAKPSLESLQQKAGTLIFKLNTKTKREAVRLLMQAPSQDLRRMASRLRYFAKIFTFEESALHRTAAHRGVEQPEKQPTEQKYPNEREPCRPIWYTRTRNLIQQHPILSDAWEVLFAALEECGGVIPHTASPRGPPCEDPEVYGTVRYWAPLQVFGEEVKKWMWQQELKGLHESAAKERSSIALLSRGLTGQELPFRPPLDATSPADKIRLRLLVGTNALNKKMCKIRTDRMANCPGGCDVEEDEEHFLLDCPEYKEARTRFESMLSYKDRSLYVSLVNEDKMLYLLGMPVQTPMGAQQASRKANRSARIFVQDAYTKRSQILEQSRPEDNEVVDLTKKGQDIRGYFARRGVSSDAPRCVSNDGGTGNNPPSAQPEARSEECGSNGPRAMELH